MSVLPFVLLCASFIVNIHYQTLPRAIDNNNLLEFCIDNPNTEINVAKSYGVLPFMGFATPHVLLNITGPFNTTIGFIAKSGGKVTTPDRSRLIFWTSKFRRISCHKLIDVVQSTNTHPYNILRNNCIHFANNLLG